MQASLPRYRAQGSDPGPSDLNLECRVESGVTVIGPPDDIVIGADNVNALVRIVLDRLSQGTPVVLDASRIEFFESEGIDGLLLFDRCATDSHVPFVLCGLNAGLGQVFRIYGLDCLFKVFPTADAAIHFLTRSSAWH
jgi:anti-anti-sigma factor